MTGVDPLLERVRAALRPEYEVESELGRGGMGVVFLAVDTGLGRQVAVKVLRPEMATADAEETFTREARNLASLKSPHVMVVHTPPRVRDGLSFFVMEYVAGGTLDQRLEAGPMTPAEVYRLGLSLLSGLEVIHARNLIHRDLKPSNVFPNVNGGLIGDFGIARDALKLTATGDGRVGTLFYMAPEQRAGVSPTNQTDIYQLGLVLYEACAGRSWADLASTSNPWSRVPWRFRRALKRALEMEPDRRWPDVAAFKRAWENRGVTSLALTSTAAVAVLVVVIKAIIPSPPLRLADLAILPLRGAAGSELQPLTRYIQEPFERFRRLSVQRVEVASRYPELLTPREFRALRSRRYVDGRVYGDTLEITVNDSAHMLRRIRVPRRSLDLFAWGRAAADSVVYRFFPGQYPDFHALAGCGGSNDKEAIDEYLIGQQAFQQDGYASAARHLSRALELDPKFALAAWQRGLAHRWLRSLSWDELRELRRQSEGCSNTWFYGLLAAQLDTDLTRRLDRYRAVIRQAPRVGMARLLYADDMYHRGALIGLPLDSAVAAMEAAIEADTAQDQAPALDHLIWGYIRLGQERKALGAIERRERLAKARASNPGSESGVRTRLLRLAFNLRFRPTLGNVQLWWAARRSDSRTLKAFSEYMHLGTAFDLPQAQLKMGQALRRSGDRNLRAEGYKAQALALMAMARPDAALAAYDSAMVLVPNPVTLLETAEWQILSPALGLPEFPAQMQGASRERLNAMLQDRDLADRAAWALAVAAYSAKDIESARAYSARLRPSVDSSVTAFKLRRLLQAIDSGEAGATAAALALSKLLLAWDPVHRSGDPFARAVLYLNRARWFAQQGQKAEAARSLLWYENGDMDGWGTGNLQEAHVDAVLSGLGRVRRASVRPANEESAGCKDLRRVLEVWKQAEPSYRPLRDSVQAMAGGCP